MAPAAVAAAARVLGGAATGPEPIWSLRSVRGGAEEQVRDGWHVGEHWQQSRRVVTVWRWGRVAEGVSAI